LNSAVTHFQFVGCNVFGTFLFERNGRHAQTSCLLSPVFKEPDKEISRHSGGDSSAALAGSNTSTNLVCTIEQPHPQQATSQQWNMCFPTAVYNPTITTNSDKKEKNCGNSGYLMFPPNQSKLSGVAMS
jgi:hypothetical protein